MEQETTPQVVLMDPKLVEALFDALVNATHPHKPWGEINSMLGALQKARRVPLDVVKKMVEGLEAPRDNTENLPGPREVPRDTNRKGKEN